MTVALPPLSSVSPDTPLDMLLDAYLRTLLADLQLLIPYDAAAAWLGHDDRPSLRVVVPDAARVPSIESARHLVFGATAEAARIGDLSGAAVGDPSGMRAWLGVPLILHGQRRGWIELWSEHPHRFTEGDLHSAEVLVRHGSLALAQLESTVRSAREAAVHRGVTRCMQAAFAAPSLRAMFETLLEQMTAIDDGIVGATLIVPVEAAYALGHELAPGDPAAGDATFDASRLTTVIARWPQTVVESAESGAESLLGPATMLAPLTHEGAEVGWVELRYRSGRLPDAIDPALLQPLTTILSALLQWLQRQAQREQQAQQSVRMLVQQAYQARSAAISDLIAGLSHEINNPVSAITGMVALLRRDETLPAAIRDDLQAIAGEAQRISSLVGRLSGFGDTAGSSRMALPLNDIVAGAVAALEALARQRGVVLDMTLPSDSPVVYGNRAQLQQACFDLLSNALDAVEGIEAPRVQVAVTTSGAWALVRVVDNGCGIPDMLHDRVFAPGFTTKSSGGTRRGLGMGLPMALDIARCHRGTIALESTIWAGSTFTLRLPLM